MKKAFVTGWPIHQSKSPMLHGFWLKHYGLEGSYEAVGVEPENFFGEKCQAHKWDELPALLSGTDFIVNTTSIGMAGSDASMMPDLATLPKSAIVTDIVYTPLGLGMLLHQAVPGFEKWFGVRPEVTDELREYILGLSS